MSTSKTASNPVAVPSASFASAPYAAPMSVTGSGDAIRNRLPWLFAGSVFLSTVALTISGYLTYVAFTSSKILGCGGGTFDCDHVLHSSWSTLLGLPVAAWASSLYLTVLVALIATARAATSTVPSAVRTWTWGIVTAAAVSAGLAALWFTGLQVFVLKHLCPWCLGAHACGLALCVATLTASPLSGRLKSFSAALGFVGTAGLVTIQLLTPAAPTYTIQEFPAPSSSGPASGAVIEEPEMFDAPGEGDDVIMAPDTNANFLPTASASTQSLLAAWFTPSMLLTTQVAAGGSQGGASQGNASQGGASQGGASQGGASQSRDQGANNEGQPTERVIHLSGANVKLKTNQWPIIGSPNAKHIFVEMFDYTCPHCRATQPAIRAARERMKDDLAIIVLPVPLSRACNDTVTSEHPSHRESCEISRIAIALWRVDARRFAEFHEWLLTVNPIPTEASARLQATKLVDPAALEKELAQPHAARYISKHVDIYRKMGAGPVPKLVFAGTTLTGEMTSPQVLIDTIQRQPAQ